jgi:sulfatase maturation enzyme AslB (radical SAM superfamily)
MLVIQPIPLLIKCLLKDDTVGYRLDARYRPLRYVVSLSSPPYLLLFNVLTKEYIALSLDEFDEFFSPQNSALSDYLIKHRFLVEESTSDYIIADTLREIIIHNKMEYWDGAISSFHIFTTTSCNVKCPYCFEKHVPVLHMNEQTSKDVAAFIIKNCDKHNILIRWFGGEPLLNCKAISIISSALNKSMVAFDSILYSNGLLFTPELIDVAKSSWHVSTVQITIDGTEDTYNKIKACNAFSNPYGVLISNIEQLLFLGIRVAVRTLITGNNKDELESLLAELSIRFASSPHFSVHVHRLFNEQRSHDFNEEHFRIEKEHLHISQSIDSLFPCAPREHLRSNIRSHYCFADSPWSASILPDGRLLPCTHYDQASQTYGSIYDEQPQKPIRCFEYLPAMDECHYCFYYPDCFRLVNCPEAPSYCNDWRKTVRLKRLQKQMLNDWECYASSHGLK